MTRHFAFRCSIRAISLLAGAVLFVAGTAFAEDATYIGAKKCKMCHKKPEQGEQFGKWEKGPHAGAYASLASEASVAKGKELGLAAPPQESPECLKCHATAFAVIDDLANQKIALEEGVSCESCHGAGSAYKKKKTMQGIRTGEIDGATVGLIEPTEEVCLNCHIEEGNPFHKEFIFAERVKEVAHPIPVPE